MKDEAPWGPTRTKAQRQLIEGKKNLLAGKVSEANRLFTVIAKEDLNSPNDKLWGYLLAAYCKRIATSYGFKLIFEPVELYPSLANPFKPLVEFDYINATEINAVIAKQEYEQYEPVAIFLQQLVLLKDTHQLELNFETLHEQAWCTHYAERFTGLREYANAQKEIQIGLTKIPKNHYLLSYKAMLFRKNITLAAAVEAERMINQAIDFCPKVPQASDDLASHYFWRARIKREKLAFVLPKSERARLQAEIISDFRTTFKSDFLYVDYVDKENYLALLNYLAQNPFLENEALEKNLQKRLNLTNQLICKDKSKVGLYLIRGKIYAELGEKDLAYLDYIIADGLIRLGIVSVSNDEKNSVKKALSEFNQITVKTVDSNKSPEVKVEKAIKEIQKTVQNETKAEIAPSVKTTQVLLQKFTPKEILESKVIFLEPKASEKKCQNLSYLFIIKNQAPWKTAPPLLQQKMQEGRDYLASGKLDQAILCFQEVEKESRTGSTVTVWAFLLHSYTDLVVAGTTDDDRLLKRHLLSATLKYKAALERDELAEQEFPIYEVIKMHIKQVLLMQIEQHEERDFYKLQEQAWYMYDTIKLIAQKKFSEAFDLAVEGLKKMPTNHLLYFVKFAEKMNAIMDGQSIQKSMPMAEEAINNALKFCPKNSFHLFRHHFHRGLLIYQKITLLKQSDTTSRLRLIKKVIKDYQVFLQGDREDHEDLNREGRLDILKHILKIHHSPDWLQITKKDKLTLQHLTTHINQHPTHLNQYIERVELYQAANEYELAYLDLSTAIWLLSLKITKSIKYNKEDLEARLINFSSETKKQKSKLQEVFEITPTIQQENEEEVTNPKKQVETPETRAARKDNRIRKEVTSVLRDMVIHVTRQFREEEEKHQIEIHSTHQFIKKLIKKNIVGPAYKIIEENKKIAEAERQKREIEEENAKKAQQEQEEKRQKEILSTHKFITTLIQQTILDPAYEIIEENKKIAEAEKQKREIEEEKEQQQHLEKMYKQQESIPFKPIATTWIPRKAFELLEAIHTLPGRLSKRTHFYGGHASKAALFNDHSNQKMDLDVRTGLPLSVIKPIIKKTFNLEKEPEEVHGILIVNFPLTEKEQYAQLTICHSDILADEELSYIEALRYDTRNLDFLQKGFMASLPQGSVYFPLNWWEFYFAESLEQVLKQINQARTAEKWSETLKSLPSPALLFIGKDKNYQVYFYIRSRLETVIKINKHEQMVLNVELSEPDSMLLERNDYGRLVMTCQNQNQILDLLNQVEKSFQKKFQKPLQSLVSDIAKEVAEIKHIETILDANFSFATDASRMLRLVHYTTLLKYKGFSPEMFAAVIFQADAFRHLISEKPGKVNSWLNKIFCREGKQLFFENLANFKFLGLLELAFPRLTLILEEVLIKNWVNNLFEELKQSERPSLNLLYAIFIKCLALRTTQSFKTIIQTNSLFHENFKEVSADSYLQQVSVSWSNYLKSQRKILKMQSFINQQHVPPIYGQMQPILFPPPVAWWVPENTPPPLPCPTQTLSQTKRKEHVVQAVPRQPNMKFR